MGKSTPDPPPAPDPNAVAAAQTKSNQQTGLYNFGLSNPNYNTPLGSLNYNVANTEPTYDNNAYNTALTAWQNAGSGPSPGMSFDQWLSSTGGTRPQAAGGDVRTSPQGMAYQNYVNGGAGSRGAMPQLSDFQTSPGGTPQVTANVSLSPEQQKLYNSNTQQSIDLSKLASELQSRVGDTLNQPLPSSGDYATTEKNAQDAYYKNQTQYLDPQFQQGKEQLDSQLANEGITQGSEAYNNAEGNFSRQKQSAYDTAQNNAILQGPQNAQQLFALSTAARNQPLTEFNALRTGAQPQMPQFQGTQPTAIQPTNVAGIQQQAYQNSLNPYNAQVAANNQMTSGLFGLGGSALGAYGTYAGMAAMSDIRLKENITYIGQEKGHKIYTFSYLADPQKLPYRGVMAQDVITYRPDAVLWDGDYMLVDYAKLGIEFGRVH